MIVNKGSDHVVPLVPYAGRQIDRLKEAGLLPSNWRLAEESLEQARSPAASFEHAQQVLGVSSKAVNEALEKIFTEKEDLTRRLLLFSPEVIARNREFLLPILEEALNGSESARRFYEERRILNPLLLDEWGLETWGDLVRRSLAYSLHKVYPNRAESAQAYAGDLGRCNETHLAHSFLFCHLPTYTGMRELVGRIKQTELDENIERLAAGSGPQIFLGDLKVLVEGKKRPAGVQMLEKLVPYTLAAFILMDLLELKNIEVSAEIGRQLMTVLRKFKPWDILNCRQVKNVIELKTAFIDREIDVSDGDAIVLRLINAKSALKDWCRENKSKEMEDPRNEVVADPQSVSVSEAALREQFLIGVTTLIEAAHYNFKDSRKLAGGIYAVSRRCSLSYDVIASEILNSKDPASIPRMLYEKYLKRSGSGSVAGQPPPPLTDEAESAIAELPAFSVLFASPEVGQEISAFAPPIQKRIEARIDLMRLGHPGDWSRITEEFEGFYESRIHVGPGIRIYYDMPNTSTYRILLVGFKADQRRDIPKAKRRMKASD